ncbi:unnamed protein product [Paramecium sonneborni]|uniref:Uncharacterized protein n=1 Tax=Paramecium sonneborni TaxID=65129 RepID=A0A8S1MN87_9CILI|nr:unnamed protein product [Paramecium sonneborni]
MLRPSYQFKFNALLMDITRLLLVIVPNRYGQNFQAPLIPKNNYIKKHALKNIGWFPVVLTYYEVKIATFQIQEIFIQNYNIKQVSLHSIQTFTFETISPVNFVFIHQAKFIILNMQGLWKRQFNLLHKYINISNFLISFFL